VTDIHDLRAMVLAFEPMLGCSVWQDYLGRYRTQAGLERQLRHGVRNGTWNGWRLIRVEKEAIGVDGEGQA